MQQPRKTYTFSYRPPCPGVMKQASEIAQFRSDDDAIAFAQNLANDEEVPVTAVRIEPDKSEVKLRVVSPRTAGLQRDGGLAP